MNKFETMPPICPEADDGWLWRALLHISPVTRLPLLGPVLKVYNPTFT